VFGMWYAAPRGGITAHGFSLAGTAAVAVVAAVALVGFLYYLVAEGWFGATLGKAIVGIRVLRSDGSRCGLRASMIRNALRVVDGIAAYLVGFLVAVLSKRRQRIGDRVADTVVTEHGSPGAIRALALIVWLALVAGGIVQAYRIHQRTPAGPGAGQAGEAAAAAPATSPAQAASSPAPVTRPEFRPSVQSTGELKMTRFDFVTGEGGAVRPYAPYHRGDVVHVEYRIEDFARDSGSRMRLNVKAMATDPRGKLLYPAWTRRIEQQSDGSPVNGSYSVELQAYMPPGDCQIRIEADDEVSGAHLEMTAPFAVEGPPIRPAERFELRDFALSMVEGGEAPARLALQGAGTVYMRCKLFGLQFQGDRVDVRMGLTVRDPTGKVALDNPDYFRSTDEFPYHPDTFFLPISGHLSVPEGMAKGTYTLEYLARDNIAGVQIGRTATLELR